jgi:hypothetical protein
MSAFTITAMLAGGASLASSSYKQSRPIGDEQSGVAATITTTAQFQASVSGVGLTGSLEGNESNSPSYSYSDSSNSPTVAGLAGL